MELNICILAGGEGKRMKTNIPKVCNMYKNKPMIVYIIEESLKLNPRKVVIITGKHYNYIYETIKKYIIENFNKLYFVIQETPLGTGNAVLCSIKEYNDNEKVLILNGDCPNIKSNLLEKFIENEENKLMISEIENPFGYGRVIMNENNEIIKIIEEKDTNNEEKKINKINSGIYIIGSNDLKKYVLEIKNNNKQKEYYLTDIIEIMNNNNKIIKGYMINKDENKYIYGVNTIDDLNNLEKM